MQEKLSISDKQVFQKERGVQTDMEKYCINCSNIECVHVLQSHPASLTFHSSPTLSS